MFLQDVLPNFEKYELGIGGQHEQEFGLKFSEEDVGKAQEAMTSRPPSALPQVVTPIVIYKL